MAKGGGGGGGGGGASKAVKVEKAAPKKPQEQDKGKDAGPAKSGGGPGIDFTAIPALLDKRFDKLDEDSALRPTIIKPGKVWSLRSQDGLLSDPKNSTMRTDAQKKAKDAAYDLLDALTRSGVLPIANASLHVVLCATHCFDKTLMNTVVQDNVNPIEKVERSQLIMVTTIQNAPAGKLVAGAHQKRLEAFDDKLAIADAPAGGGGAAATQAAAPPAAACAAGPPCADY